jgi:hypothetical protein
VTGKGRAKREGGERKPREGGKEWVWEAFACLVSTVGGCGLAVGRKTMRGNELESFRECAGAPPTAPVRKGVSTELTTFALLN